MCQQMKAARATGRIHRSNYPDVQKWIAAGDTAIQIGARLAVNPETVRKFARRRGLEIVRHDAEPERHPSWRGGKTTDRQGYILRLVERDGEYGYLIRSARKGDPRGYAPEHRIVMHQKLRRKLRPGEVVHHIDEDNTNNAPDNLQLFPKNADHLAETLKGKVPNWTPEGKARMTGRPRKHSPKVPAP